MADSYGMIKNSPLREIQENSLTSNHDGNGSIAMHSNGTSSERVEVDIPTPGAPPYNKKQYNYWRVRILYSMIFGYAAFYLVRQNFPMAIPAIQAEFGYSKTQIGWVLSFFSIIYGVGKFVNGFVSDRISARYFMTIGLLISAGVNFCVGFHSGLVSLMLLWGVNAWVQSMGAPTCARLLAHWFSPRERGTKWGIWNASHQIGGAVIYILSAYLVAEYGWRYAFTVPSFMALICAVFLFERLRDTPQSLGLPTIERYQGLTEDDHHPEERLSLRELVRAHILFNRPLWCFCIANFFLYIVRMGVFNWAPTFLEEAKGSSVKMAGNMVAGFEILGLCGGIAAGWLSDKYFGGRRGLVAALYTSVLFFFLLYFWQIPAGNPIADTVALVGVGFFVYGPQVLGGVAAVDMVPKHAVGAANGLTGTFAYLGSAVAGVGVGWVADRWGWDAGFVFFIIASVLSTFFFALTWRQRAAILDNNIS